MARPLLCATVTAASTAELRRRRDETRDVDMIELRLDSVADPDVAGALRDRRCPAIVTCRPTWEGGRFAGSEEERRRLLAEAIVGGAEYVDVEWSAGFHELFDQSTRHRIVLSTHDFEAMPADLVERRRAMRATGAGVIKIAGRANRLADCAALLPLAEDVHEGDRQVLIAMGERGLATRVLAEQFGSAWTYAGPLAEAGQIDARSLVHDFGFRSLSRSTAVYGLVGAPIGHSVSPAMHNRAFRSAGLDAVYLPLPAVDVGDFMTFADRLGLKGASVTIPFKVPMLGRMDGLEADAQRIGAVNTIRINDGRWLGSNTDACGFLGPLHQRGVPLRGIRAAVLGAGGSARAVACALSDSGAHVTVHARDTARAADVAALATGSVGGWPPKPGSWDLLVNCTPVGMYPRSDETPLASPHLSGALVYDLVYNPTPTRLLREAAGLGCQTIGGLEMLVAQAEEQFRLWTNVAPPCGVMRQAAEERLSEFITDDHHLV